MKDIKLLGTSNGQFYGDLNDVTYDSQGKMIMVEGIAFTRQAITKSLLTLNLYDPYPSYGAALQGIIKSGMTLEDAQNLMVATIIFAVTYYNQTAINPTPDQIVDNILSIDITQPAMDTFEITLVIQLQDGQLLSISLGS